MDHHKHSIEVQMTAQDSPLQTADQQPITMQPDDLMPIHGHEPAGRNSISTNMPSEAPEYMQGTEELSPEELDMLHGLSEDF